MKGAPNETRTHSCKSTITVTIFTIRAAFRSINKDVLPIFRQSNLIDKFQCHCNAIYIGRSSQRLEVKVTLHIPRDIHNLTTSGHSKLLNSAICKYLNVLNNCGVNYSDECFVALQRARMKQHQIVLEVIYILLNRTSLNPRHSLNLLGDICCLT